MTSNRRLSSRLATPIALVATGMGMGVLFTSLAGVPSANAQSSSPPPETILSAGDQRRQLIEAMREVSQRVARIETKLNSPLSVKVLEMPAVKINDSK